MARQKGTIRLDGSLGALSFYHDKRYGDMVRGKGGPSKEQIQALPSCEVVRQNNSDFGTASRAGKLLRESFYHLLHYVHDYRLNGRVQKRMMEVLKRDTKHTAGSRLLAQENFATFGLLELHRERKAGDTFPLPVQRSLEQDCMKISTDVTINRSIIKGATHFKVVSVAALIHFSKVRHYHHTLHSAFLALEERTPLHFTHELKEGGVLFHGMCVVFYQQINGEFYLLQDDGLSSGFIACVV
jgi:hypothetical protein